MTREEIEIQILPDGSVQYTIRGVKGAACDSISQVLEQLGKIEHAEHTAEYYDLDNESVISVAEQ